MEEEILGEKKKITYSIDALIKEEILFGKKDEYQTYKSLMDLIDVTNLLKEMDKVSTKDAYIKTVEFLNNRYREILTGKSELKGKKPSLIKSSILRSYEIDMSSTNINENYGVSYDVLKKIVSLFLCSAIGPFVSTLALNSGNELLFYTSTTISTLAIISLFRTIGVTALGRIIENDSIEQHFQKLIFAYKRGDIDQYEFKKEMARIIDILNKYLEQYKLEGEKNAKSR